MAKRAVKKAAKAKKSTKSAKRKNDDSLIYIAVLSIFVVLLVAVGYYFYAHSSTTQQNDVLATVNGQAITQQQLDFQYNLLPAYYREQVTKEQVLEQMIDEEVIVQASRAGGEVVTPEELDARIQEIVDGAGITMQQLQDNLATLNVSMDAFKSLVERQILIQAYTDKNIAVNPPSDADLKSLYDASKDSFTVPEQVTVKHVLIAIQQPDAAVTAKKVYDLAKSGANFCDLVTNYTDDKGSVNTCGEYTFPRGYMVPEFENASFDMKPGDFRMVQTVFGYHIIEKINSTPASVQSFADVRNQLEAQYNSTEKIKQYKILTSDLRAKATIVYGQGTAQEESKETDQEANQEYQDSAPADTQQGQTVPTDAPSDAAPADMQVENQQSGDLEQDLAQSDCIAQHVKLYGESWSSASQDARNLVTGVQYVACDETPDACKTAGVQAYPTWEINGQLHLEPLTKDQIINLAGC